MTCNCPRSSYGVKHTEQCYDALAEKLRETEMRLRMYGGHTANCAYHLSHYKGPVSQCDCKWTDLVPAVFAGTSAQRAGDANG